MYKKNLGGDPLLKFSRDIPYIVQLYCAEIWRQTKKHEDTLSYNFIDIPPPI